MPKPLVQLQAEEMNARYKISELAQTKALDQFQEASAKLTQICSTDGQSVVPDKGTSTEPDMQARTYRPAWMVRSFAEVTKHGLSLHRHERSCEKVSQWRTKVDPILREPIPLMGCNLAPLTALFQDRERTLHAHLDQVPLNYPSETVVQPSSTAHFHYGFPTVEPLSRYSNKLLSSNLKTAIFQPCKRCHTP